MKKSRIICAVLTGLLVAMVLSVGASRSGFADPGDSGNTTYDPGSGGGSNGGGSSTVRYIQTDGSSFNNPTDFGGASWVIFKLTNPPLVKDPNTLSSLNRNQPYLWHTDGNSTHAITLAGLKQYKKNTVTQQCSTTDFSYYVAYVWRGQCRRKGNSKRCLSQGEASSSDNYIYIGPVNWGSKLTKDNGTELYPIYNNKGDTSYKTIKSAIAKGTLGNGTIIHGQRPKNNSDDTKESKSALNLYNKYLKWLGRPPVNLIPSNIAFFCLPTGRADLTAYAVAGSQEIPLGSKIYYRSYIKWDGTVSDLLLEPPDDAYSVENPDNPIPSKNVSVTMPYTLYRADPENATYWSFSQYGTKCSGSTSVYDATCTIQNLKEDVDRYAYYSAQYFRVYAKAITLTGEPGSHGHSAEDNKKKIGFNVPGVFDREWFNKEGIYNSEQIREMQNNALRDYGSRNVVLNSESSAYDTGNMPAFSGYGHTMDSFVDHPCNDVSGGYCFWAPKQPAGWYKDQEYRSNTNNYYPSGNIWDIIRPNNNNERKEWYYNPDAKKYYFLGWSNCRGRNALSPRCLITTEQTTPNYYDGTIKGGNKYIYAVYSDSGGRSNVGPETTGVVTPAVPPSSGFAAYYINSCSATEGCLVEFSHELLGENIDYTITRTSNMPYDPNTGRGYSSGQIGAGVSPAASKTNFAKVRSETLRLYPGQVVCENLIFGISNNQSIWGPISTGQGSASVCASALGTANTELNIKVKDEQSASKYRVFQKDVYAKPNDQAVYQTNYRSVPQYYYNSLIPRRVQVNGGNVIPATTTNEVLYINQLFGNWNNAFSLQLRSHLQSKPTEFSSEYSTNYYYTRGDASAKEKTYNYNIISPKVGYVITGTAILNANILTKHTPSRIEFNSYDFNTANIFTEENKDEARVHVPYNFRNTTKVLADNDPKKRYFYAGEEATVGFEVAVGKRPNAETNGTYATIVRGAKYKIRIRYQDTNGIWRTATTDIRDINSRFSNPGELNSQGKIDGTTEKITSLQGGGAKINIPDLPAGSKIYVTSMVYPKDSYNDTAMTTDLYNINSESSWAKSDEVEFTVAKKPSISIWGGNIYTAGKIKTAVANKNNLAGYSGDLSYNINPDTTKQEYLFGSWTELGLIGAGEITGLASGAGTGVGTNSGGTLTPAITANTIPNNGRGNNNGSSNPGGKKATDSKSSSFCARSTLSFANGKCANGTVGNLGTSNSITKATSDRDNIISRLEVTNADKTTKHKTGATLILKHDELDESKKTTNENYYYYNDNDITLGSGDTTSTIKKATTHMVHSDKNIIIAGNIEYEGTYRTMAQIPKLIIYAEKNIIINCNVGRIDALIIAGGKVTTCDSNNINNQENSNQLVINGSIVAGRLEAKRTYGAATGNNSIIPAEIIDFDPSLYFFTVNNKSSASAADQNTDLTTTRLIEVAPRY